MDLNQQFIQYLKKLGKKPATVESYSRDARVFMKYLDELSTPLAAIAPETVVAYQDYLKDQRHERPNSIRRMVIGLRQFYRFLEHEHLVSSSPLEKLNLPKRIEKYDLTINQDKIDKIMNFCRSHGSDIESSRNASIISLLAFEGIKASEIINLKWSGLTGALETGHSCFLSVPGSRHRTIKLDSATIDCVRKYQIHYLELKQQFPLKLASGFMLVGFMGRNSSRLLPRLTRHGLKFILNEIGIHTDIIPLNSEALRHFAIGFQLNHGFSEEDIMAHLGLRRPGNITHHVQSQRGP